MKKRIADRGGRKADERPGYTDKMAATGILQVMVRLSNRICAATRAVEMSIKKAPGGIDGIETHIDPDELAEFRTMLAKLREFRKDHRPIREYDRTPTGDLIDPVTGDTYHPKTGEKTGNVRS